MFDVMDHVADLTPSPSPKGEGSMLRWELKRAAARRALVRFAKFFLVEYLNSGKDVEQVVDEWLTLTPDQR